MGLTGPCCRGRSAPHGPPRVQVYAFSPSPDAEVASRQRGLVGRQLTTERGRRSACSQGAGAASGIGRLGCLLSGWHVVPASPERVPVGLSLGPAALPGEAAGVGWGSGAEGPSGC